MAAQKPKNLQEWFEQNVFALMFGTALAVSVASIVEIVPLFYLDNTYEHTTKDESGNLKSPELLWDRGDKRLFYKDEAGNWASDWKAGDGVRPYTPLELAGKDIYMREHCTYCHSQMIRPFRDERERYGHYSLGTESVYDHPFQWGSKRTGPDLARVGGKFSNEWHYMHLMRPQALVPESVMPAYPWLAENSIENDFFNTKRDMKARLEAMRLMGVPYTQEDIDNANEHIKGYTEMDAIIAYMQVLGTMVKLDDNKVYRE